MTGPGGARGGPWEGESPYGGLDTPSDPLMGGVGTPGSTYDAAAYREKHPIPSLACSYCARTYQPKIATRRAKNFCSAPCRRLAGRYPRSRLYYRDCLSCGRFFLGRSSPSSCCSDACRTANSKRYWLEWHRNDYGPDRRILARETAAIRRARQFDAAHEKIEMRRLYERDKGLCGICGEPARWVTATRQTRPPDMATIDHIIPLARGGAHTWPNVQLAHLICNQKKHATVVA